MRKLLLPLLTIGFAGLMVLGVGYDNALDDPIIRTATVEVAEWPDDAPPMRVLALSDVHVAGPDMPPERLRRIVDRLMELRPDLIVVSGDLVSEKRMATEIFPAQEILEAMSRLEAPLGVIIVPGNHDHWAGLAPFLEAATQHDFTVLQNNAVSRGPFRIVGIDDDYSGHADPPKAMNSLSTLPRGIPLLVTHSPDIIPAIRTTFRAIFAGHTHCGQISLPGIGPVATMSRYGRRFACGDIADAGQRIFVSAGLGTSLLPLRFGAPPDVWLVRFGPEV